MSPTIEKIKEELKDLSVDEMVELHEKLIERIHEKDEKFGLEPESKAVLQRRIHDIDKGNVSGKDAYESLDNL